MMSRALRNRVRTAWQPPDSLAIFALCLAGAWPYLRTISWGPFGGDAPVWVGRAALSNPDWYEWVFFGDHFSWYRPVTALTYTINDAVAGLNPIVYRATDLVLHLMVALLCLYLVRTFLPSAPRWVGHVALALCLVHPVVERTVPYMARRSFALAIAAGLASLVVIGWSLRRGKSPWAWPSFLSGGLFACSILSNELGILTVGLAPFVALRFSWSSTRPVRTALHRCVIPLTAAAAAFLVRFPVIGGIGGYRFHPDRIQPAGTIAADMWDILTGGSWSTGTFPATAVLTLVLLYYLWRGLLEPCLSLREPHSLLRLAMAAWLIGFVLLSIEAGWLFKRSVYVALAPFAILVAVILYDTLSRFRSRTALVVHLIPQALLIGGLVLASPVVHGQNPNRLKFWKERHRLIEAMATDLAVCHEPAQVLAVLPLAGPDRAAPRLGRISRVAVDWTNLRFGDREIAVDEFVYYAARDGGAPLLKKVEGDEWLLELAGGRRYVRRGQGFEKIRDDVPRELRLGDLPSSTKSANYVYLYFDGAGELQAIHEPTADHPSSTIGTPAGR